MDPQRATPGHGGILFPLEVFRPTVLAAALAESLIARARNILDAQIVFTRHPEIQLVLVTITGSVVGSDVGLFWRENAELAIAASHALPRQCFLYFVCSNPERREGFLVAQRGQAVAGDDATADRLPADATEVDWPVHRLCEQIGLSVEELSDGFAGGPSVSISLVEPEGDDRSILMALAGTPATTSDPAAAPPPPAVRPPSSTSDDEKKRRETEARAETDARHRAAEEASRALEFVMDEVGMVVGPRAELGDADVLARYLVPVLHGDLPNGVPAQFHDSLQGKRIDFAVRVEFFSEVFIPEHGPLSRPYFESHSQPGQLDGLPVHSLEVLAPRLGPGILMRADTGGVVFTTRPPGLGLPEPFLGKLLRR